MEKVKIKKNRKVKTRIEFHDEKVFHSSFFVVRNVEQFFFCVFRFSLFRTIFTRLVHYIDRWTGNSNKSKVRKLILKSLGRVSTTDSIVPFGPFFSLKNEIFLFARFFFSLAQFNLKEISLYNQNFQLTECCVRIFFYFDCQE